MQWLKEYLKLVLHGNLEKDILSQLGGKEKSEITIPCVDSCVQRTVAAVTVNIGGKTSLNASNLRHR